MYFVRKDLALSGNIYNIAEYTTDEWAKSYILSGCHGIMCTELSQIFIA